jgi:transcriptional regulator with XRE-family HTH domain
MALKDRIRDLRQARGWTQTELAKHANLRQGTITNLETGARDNPTRDTLDKLAAAFGITVQELLGEGDILSGEFPAANLRALGLTDDFLLRYQRIWVDLRRDDRAWLLGHLRIVADAERRIQALEATAHDDPPNNALPARAELPSVLAHIIT